MWSMATTLALPLHGTSATPGIQAQYYWYNATTATSYAQAGSIINVNPGDEITTTINFNARTGTIVASIADKSLSGSVGVSTITIARPFPNDPSLFASWSDFFNRAATASKSSYVMSTPAADVETDFVDQPTMCGLLPFRLRDRAKTSSQLRLDGVVPFGQSFMALQ